MLGSRTSLKKLLLNYRYASRRQSQYEQLKKWRIKRIEKRIKMRLLVLLIFGLLCLVGLTFLKYLTG